MQLTGPEEDEVFWNYRDLALFLGLAVPCLIGGAMAVKVVLLALYISTPHKALELLPGQFLGYALLFVALALILRFDYGRPFWRSLGWRWPKFSIPSMVALGFGLAFSIAIIGALLKTPEPPSAMKE